MSKFTEYLKLLPRGLKNWDLVIQGYVNNIRLEHGHLPQDQQEEILKRRLTCDGCPWLSTNAVKEGYQTDRIDEHCSLCGCPKNIRTAALDKACGVEDWNDEHPEEPRELKWTAYKK